VAEHSVEADVSRKVYPPSDYRQVILRLDIGSVEAFLDAPVDEISEILCYRLQDLIEALEGLDLRKEIGSKPVGNGEHVQDVLGGYPGMYCNPLARWQRNDADVLLGIDHPLVSAERRSHPKPTPNSALQEPKILLRKRKQGVLIGP